MQYKSLKISMVASVLSLASTSNVAHANLIAGNFIHEDSSVGVKVVYDTQSNLTWLQDALSYDADGKEGKDRWGVISSWAGTLDLDDISGADGWRLPEVYSSKPTSEFSELFSRSDFNSAGFSNIQQGDYWTGTTFIEDGIDKAYIYHTQTGESVLKQSSKRYAWAVIEGDFASLSSTDIPEPSNIAILGLGLLGLFTRKSKLKSL